VRQTKEMRPVFGFDLRSLASKMDFPSEGNKTSFLQQCVDSTKTSSFVCERGAAASEDDGSNNDRPQQQQLDDQHRASTFPSVLVFLQVGCATADSSSRSCANVVRSSRSGAAPRYLPHPPTAQFAVPKLRTPRTLLPSLCPPPVALLGGRYDWPWCRWAYVRLCDDFHRGFFMQHEAIKSRADERCLPFAIVDLHPNSGTPTKHVPTETRGSQWQRGW
jgi:hypothetical protein